MNQLPLLEHGDLSTVQYFTPEWAAELLVERYFPELAGNDLVLEPSAGRGAFLKVIPSHVPAIGVELDPALAAIAEANSGRRVIVGDFATVELPEGVTAILGNPPFEMRVFERFLARSRFVLPELGKVGMLLPAYVFQTHTRVLRWLEHWSMRAEMLPRTLFPLLSMPIVFATFRRDQRREMVGFALYVESGDLDRMGEQTRELLREGKPRKGAWRSVVEMQLERHGGSASLAELYSALEYERPTPNQWWREKVRQILQLHFVSLGDGRWSLSA